jgi:hypothetical protein
MCIQGLIDIDRWEDEKLKDVTPADIEEESEAA